MPLPMLIISELLLLFIARYSNDSAPELTGPLAVNNLLKRGERLFEDEIMGPEALVTDKDGMFVMV